MNRSDVLTLYDYNYWANGRVLSATANVSPELFTAPFMVSHGSLRGTLVHILAAEVVWRLRCQEGISPPSSTILAKREPVSKTCARKAASSVKPESTMTVSMLAGPA